MMRGSDSNLQETLSADAECSSGTKDVIMTAGGEVGTDSGYRRVITVANFLPLLADKDPEMGNWNFARDEDSLLLQMRDGFPPETEVIYVGCLKKTVDTWEQEEVYQELYQKYRCAPVFLKPEIQERFYLGFCKGQLWPLFHYKLPISSDLSKLFDPALFRAYVTVNREFARVVMRQEDGYVWVHDYHLMLVPTFLRRKRRNRLKMGFFLHSPFPSSEIYRTLPVREEILRGLLSADLVGFHTFDYARHFLSCCSRILGLDHELKGGYIGLDYCGRSVTIKILPVGIHVGRLQSILSSQETAAKIQEIQERYSGKRLILGVDDMDIFKGIGQKLLGFELFLKNHPNLGSNVVLVQIANPPRGTMPEDDACRDAVMATVERINEAHGGRDHPPIVFRDGGAMDSGEKAAYCASAECFVVNAVRDGMNLAPYEYIVCREDHRAAASSPSSSSTTPGSSTLVLSEFLGCSPSLSGAIRVNPWSAEEVSGALVSALSLAPPEKELRHARHHRYVTSHDLLYWVGSFLRDLERACRDHDRSGGTCLDVGLALDARVVALPPGLRRLSFGTVASWYGKTRRRVFFLDYDGTVVPRSSIGMAPSSEVISILEELCSDAENTVFIVSGRGRDQLGDWFSAVDALGIAAEHGLFIRWSKQSEWETDDAGAADFGRKETSPSPDQPAREDAPGSIPGRSPKRRLASPDGDTTHRKKKKGWKGTVEEVMASYAQATEGSYVESKKRAVVWHHREVDPGLGSWQARELVVHLRSVLANEPVTVTRGHHIVEVKPHGVGKGTAVQKVLSALASGGRPPEFILCIGDDRSDEEMFESVRAAATSGPVPAVVFPCTVGLQPSKAEYYVEETGDVTDLLRAVCQKQRQHDHHPAEEDDEEEGVSFERSTYGL